MLTENENQPRLFSFDQVTQQDYYFESTTAAE